MREMAEPLRQYLLSLADDEHLMGQRHSEWVGAAPFLEEDVVLAGIGRDELGHAAALYGLLVGDDDEAIDRLAFRRPAEEYRSCWLVEYEAKDWAETVVRHWFYDTVERMRWSMLASSSMVPLAELAKVILQREAFHLQHVNGMLDVLLAANESRRRIEFAAIELWPLALGLFDGVAGEQQLVVDGIIAGPMVARLPSWRIGIQARLPSIDWKAVDDGSCTVDQAGRTVRHRDFDAVYARMREVLKSDPAAIW